MAKIEVTGKDALDWIFRVMALAAPIAVGWAWQVDRDVVLMQQAAETQEAAVVQKLIDLKADYEMKIKAQDTAHTIEMGHIKGQMAKIETIERQAGNNALKLVEIDVKLDQARKTLDEIKNLVVESR